MSHYKFIPKSAASVLGSLPLVAMSAQNCTQNTYAVGYLKSMMTKLRKNNFDIGVFKIH